MEIILRNRISSRRGSSPKISAQKFMALAVIWGIGPGRIFWVKVSKNQIKGFLMAKGAETR